MSSASRALVGAHVFTAGRLASTGLRTARAIGAGVVQVFVSNPRGWAVSPGDPDEDRRFRDGCAETATRVFVHAPYLVNLGSPTEATRSQSASALRHCLRRADAIGADGVVFHAGSAAGGPLDRAYAASRELLLPLLDSAADCGVRLIVEPTAGGGMPLASTLDELAAYLASVAGDPRLGVCLDTCHLHAAGHDLSTGSGAVGVLDAAASVVGDRLAVLHVNDSVGACGSRRDRHTGLATGTIAPAAIAAVVAHPLTRGCPAVVETPGSDADHAREVALLAEWRAL